MKSNTLVFVGLICAIFLVVSWTAAAGRPQPEESKVEETKATKVGKDYYGGGGGGYNHGGGGYGGGYNHGGGGYGGGGYNHGGGGGGYNHGGGGGGYNHGGGGYGGGGGYHHGRGGSCYHGYCGHSCCSSAEEAKAFALNAEKP